MSEYEEFERGVYWQRTSELRILLAGPEDRGRLQQKWVQVKGAPEWRDVPFVTADTTTKPPQPQDGETI